MVAQVLAVQDISQNGVVPSNYVMPKDTVPTVLVEGKSVPVIDLHHLKLDEEQRLKVIRDMAAASDDWGFFQVVNHGIDVGLLKKAQDVSRGFFELPREEKLKYAAKKHGFQEDGYGSRVFRSDDAKQLWRDYILLLTLPMKSRNTDNWPSIPEDYKKTMAQLSDELLVLADRVFEFLSLGLDLPAGYIKEKFGEATQSILTNYYPACPEPEKVLGFMPHSDFGGLTLLLQDETPGLQVLKDDSWIIVEPIPGAITVNISDLLELMSNGRYKSVTHRVRVLEKNRSRMSIASNYSCPFDGTVAPAEELIDEAHPQLYRPVVFGDYVAIVAQKGPTGKAYMRIE